MTTSDIWTKKIEGALEDARQIPLWGNPPSFPWETLAQRLVDALHIPPLKISLERTEFLPFEKLLDGMGSHPVVLPIELSPLSGKLFWAISSEDVHKLTTFALYPSQPAKGFSDQKMEEGFYQFLILEVLSAIEQLHVYPDFSIKLLESSPLPHEGAFCLDVSLTIHRQKLWGRLICPPSFHEAFKAHFSLHRPSMLSSPLAKHMEVSIRLELGQTTLGIQQWQQVETGDFIILDRSSFDPKTQKGTLTMVLENTPLFQVRLKENSIKILDYAFYYEEDKNMDKSNPEDENEENKEEFGEEPFAEEELPPDSTDNAHLWSSKDKENHTLEKMIASHEIPIALTIEVARFKMSLEKLLQLQPGNVIELAVHPEQGVDITVQGQRVAKGELIKIGDALGVRILQIKEHA